MRQQALRSDHPRCFLPEILLNVFLILLCDCCFYFIITLLLPFAANALNFFIVNCVFSALVARDRSKKTLSALCVLLQLIRVLELIFVEVLCEGDF